jgi:hypothetical protein
MLQNNSMHPILKKGIDDKLVNVDQNSILLYKRLFDR